MEAPVVTNNPLLTSSVTVVAVDVATLIRQIKDALNSDNPRDQAMIFTNQLLALIKSDRWAAARFAESPEAGEWRTELMRVTAQNWAAANATEAAKWAAQLADPNESDTMLGCVCFQAAQPICHKRCKFWNSKDTMIAGR